MIRALAPSIKYVLQGEEVYQCEGRTYRVRAGEFILAEAGSEFAVRTPGNETTLGLCIYLPGDEAAGLPTKSELGAPIIGGGGLDPLCGVLGRHARHLAELSSPGDALAAGIVAEVEHGINRFLGRFEHRLDRLRAVKRSTRVEMLQRLERARHYLHAHRHAPVTLDGLARHAALSRFHLSRNFAEAYGAPPLLYHRRLRLEFAAERLRRGESSPTRVAEELGYGSLSAFTRAFRQQFGVPPGRLASLR